MILVHNPFPETPDSQPATKEEAEFGKGLKNYRDMVAYADKMVGKLVDAVDRLGLRRRPFSSTRQTTEPIERSRIHLMEPIIKEKRLMPQKGAIMFH